MKYQYFCSYHAERLKACESEAFRSWTEMMRRGVNAYVECRVDAANIYLGSALEIAMLRSSCAENAMFKTSHLIKPSEFLVQLMILDRRFDHATIVLSKLSTHMTNLVNDSGNELSAFLSSQYQAVDLAEKDYLIQAGQQVSHTSAAVSAGVYSLGHSFTAH